MFAFSCCVVYLPGFMGRLLLGAGYRVLVTGYWLLGTGFVFAFTSGLYRTEVALVCIYSMPSIGLHSVCKCIYHARKAFSIY